MRSCHLLIPAFEYIQIGNSEHRKMRLNICRTQVYCNSSIHVLAILLSVFGKSISSDGGDGSGSGGGGGRSSSSSSSSSSSNGSGKISNIINSNSRRPALIYCRN